MDWAGRAAFEGQYLTGSYCLYHSFSVIVAQPLSFTFGFYQKNKMFVILALKNPSKIASMNFTKFTSFPEETIVRV